MRYFSHSKWKQVFTLTAVTITSLGATGASADEVTKWNLITVNATKTDKFNSNLGSRVDAMEAIAVYDAVNAIKYFGSPYHYSKSLGSLASATRTADQTHIARFYMQDAELTVNEATRILAEKHGTSLEVNALIFALVDIAVADARIVIWEAKYHYNFWRPVTALNANPNGTVTNGYIAWAPLLVTPPHPEYLSGHSVTVAAGVAILEKFYGDRNPLTLHTTTPGERPRTVTSLTQLAEENGLSRIYGGIHYSFSNGRAQRVGRNVAEFILKNGPHALKN